MAVRIDIGIDGGGSGCRVALSVDGGDPTEHSGGPANIVTDPAGAEAALRETLGAALDAHGLTRGDLSRARICAGLAGARLPGAADTFAARLPFPAHVVDDSRTALEGAFGDADGTLAGLGTGSFFIRRHRGETRHIGGWGFHLGDEGSAAWLGRRALRLALHGLDGRLPDDSLMFRLVAAARPDPVSFARAARPADFARLAGLIADAPGSPLARRLLADAMDALRDGLRDVGHRPGAPWALVGGLGARLAGRLPPDLAATRQEARGRPLDGALRLARGLP